MSIPKLEFPPFHLPAEAEALRVEVRAFLKQTLPRLKTEDRFASWNTRSSEFSKAMGKKGWIGITWPRKYGGSERTFLDRYVITEELLGNSAPAGAHWVADRQSGPLLLRFGSEQQRRAGAGRLPRQRHQGLDLGRPSQPLLHRPGAYVWPARRPPQGPEPTA